MQIKHKKIIFIILFSTLGFGLMQIHFTQIIGSNLKFTLFDFYGPIASGFVGSVWGLIAVILMQISNWALHGFAMDTGTLIRFLPMLMATLYFARKNKIILIVPAIAMIAFWAHPEGRASWYYALYWLIPFAMFFFHEKFIFARAIGTTFTAHSVGSVLFLYAFNLKAETWLSLIPIVWKERGLMALGITLTFLIFNFILQLLSNKIAWLDFLTIKNKYTLEKK